MTAQMALHSVEMIQLININAVTTTFRYIIHRLYLMSTCIFGSLWIWVGNVM